MLKALTGELVNEAVRPASSSMAAWASSAKPPSSACGAMRALGIGGGARGDAEEVENVTENGYPPSRVRIRDPTPTPPPWPRVTLNRPEVRNAFNDGVIAALTADLHRARTDTDAARGGAGRSWQGLLRQCRPELDARHGRLQLGREPRRRAALAEMLWTLDQCPVPVIGRVHGDCNTPAAGAGRGLRRRWRPRASLSA